MSGGAGRLPHVPALDGVRGAAVAAVVLFHAGHLRGGFLGVDLFFVLSGFLITSLLLVEGSSSGRIRLGAFWARRARRLLPALGLLLLGVAGYCLVLAEPHELARIRADALATIGYVANWRAVLQTHDYFDLFRTPSPLQHTWSLAIEEQFYLVWPLVFTGLLAWRRARIRLAVLVTAAIGAVLSVAAMTVLSDSADPSRAYYGTDTRASGILLGAVLAAVLAGGSTLRTRTARVALEAAGIAGVVVIALAWARLDGDADALYRGGFLATQVAALLVIAAVMQPGSLVLGRALAWRPLCALGLISYGVYLWHWPVDIVVSANRTALDGWPLFALQTTVTIAIATASYFVVEMPIRRGAGSPRTWLVAVPATVLAVALTFAVLQPRIDAARAASPPADQGNSVRALTRQRHALSLAHAPAVPRAVLLGDSVAYTLAVGAPHGPAAPIAVANAPLLGCGLVAAPPVGVPSFKPARVCATAPRIWRRAVDVFHPELLVLLAGPWDLTDHRVDGKQVSVGSREYAQLYTRRLEMLSRVAREGGAEVALLSAMCLDPSESDLRYATEIDDPRRARRLNALLADFARHHAEEVAYVDVRRAVCPRGATRPELRGQDVTTDGVHLTRAGSRELWTWLMPKLHAALTPPAPDQPAGAHSLSSR